MIENTIYNLKSQGLIGDNNIVIVCKDTVSAFAGFGGAIGAALAASRCNKYIIAANSSLIRIFDIDKKDDFYLGTHSDIVKNKILKVSVGGLIGGKNIVIKADFGTVKFTAQNKLKGVVQKDQLAAFTDLMKTAYSNK